MLQVLLNSAKPIIVSNLKTKCKEKLLKNEGIITISCHELEKMLLEYLGVDFITIKINNENIDLIIDEDLINE